MNMPTKQAVNLMLKRLTPTELADAMNCASVVSVYQWKSGRTKMSKKNAEHFDALYGVTINDAV